MIYKPIEEEKKSRLNEDQMTLDFIRSIIESKSKTHRIYY